MDTRFITAHRSATCLHLGSYGLCVSREKLITAMNLALAKVSGQLLTAARGPFLSLIFHLEHFTM